jgi:outer membrane protein assembly factor BamB
VLVAGVVDARRDADRAAVLAQVPGVVGSLERPVEELWRARDRPLGELHPVGGRVGGGVGAPNADRLVGAVEGPHGVVDVVALDPLSGRDVWRTTVGAGTADAGWTRCVAAGAPTSSLACVVVDATATTEQSALGSKTYPTSARLVVVDVVTGEVVRDGRTAPTGVLATTGGDLVVADVDDEGRARVTRTEPRTGAVRWSFTSPVAIPTDQFRQRTVRLEAAGDLLAVDGGPVWVLTAGDGALVDDWQPRATLGTGGQVQLLAGGTMLARPAAADGGWGSEVLDRAGARRSTARGYPVPVRPDDGSLAGTVLMLSVEGLDVLALDVGSGRVRWSAPAGSGGRPVVVDGRVVRAEGRTLSARHGRTGDVLWSVPLEAPTRSPVMTDGRSAVVSVPRPGGGGALVAIALDDGRREWSVDLPEPVVLSSAGRLLLGWTGAALVAFGPAGGTG